MEHVIFLLRQNASMLGIDFYEYVLKILEEKQKPFYDYITGGNEKVYNNLIEELDLEVEKLKNKIFDRIALKKYFFEEIDRIRHEKYTRPERTILNKEIAEYYASLELPYASNIMDVKKAYRNLLHKYHPDKFANEPDKIKLSEELTIELNNAYKKILNFLEKNENQE